MSSDSQAASLPVPVLSAIERRVLGVLVEKAKTTPDVYPLSLNSLVTGCNQKSNRDPIMNLADHEVEDVLTDCQKKGLAVKITGGRVERWRHVLYETWHVNKVELAILAELLLRGPQTEGELRARASRMEPIADLDALRAALEPLCERKLIVYLTEQGKRGTMLTHGFHDAREIDQLRSTAAVAHVPAEVPARSPSPETPGLAAQVAELRSQVAELQTAIADLAQQLRALQNVKG
jgi:uncharacterized protein